MKKHKNKSTNNDIEYTIKTKPNDGFVHKKHIEPVNIDNIGKYHKGYTTTKVHMTSNPKITRPFAYGVCAVFMIVGIFLLLLKSWFMGIIFISFAIFSFVSAKKDIDQIANELKKQGKKVTFESHEEKDETINSMKENFKEVKEDTFTREKVNWFVKYMLPIYCLVTVLLFVFISIVVNIVLGLLILGICILVGIVYYSLLSKICKK